MSYTAHIDSGWHDSSQRLYVWRHAADGRMDIVSMGELTVKRVEVTEGTAPDAKPFMHFQASLWPEIDGILKALHDLYRQVHKLEEPTSHERELQAVEEALRIERARVDRIIDRGVR